MVGVGPTNEPTPVNVHYFPFSYYSYDDETIFTLYLSLFEVRNFLESQGLQELRKENKRLKELLRTSQAKNIDFENRLLVLKRVEKEPLVGLSLPLCAPLDNSLLQFRSRSQKIDDVYV